MFLSKKTPLKERKNEQAINKFVKKLVDLPALTDLVVSVITAGLAVFELWIDRPHGSIVLGVTAAFGAALFSFLGMNALFREMQCFGFLNKHQTLNAINGLTPEKFLRLVKSFYMISDHIVNLMSRRDKHDIPSLSVKKGKEMLLVHCLHCPNDIVLIDTIKSIYESMYENENTRCVIITSGVFEGPAFEWGKTRKIEMINGSALSESIMAKINHTPPQNLECPPLPAAVGIPHIPRILFVDFDGLSRVGTESIVNMLSKHPEFVVVATTGDQSIEQLRPLLPGQEYRLSAKTERIVNPGSTGRFFEILSYLRTIPGGPRAEWIAIDTQPIEFPSGCSELLSVHPEIGFLDINVFNRLSEMMGLIDRRLSNVRA